MECVLDNERMNAAPWNEKEKVSSTQRNGQLLGFIWESKGHEKLVPQ